MLLTSRSSLAWKCNLSKNRLPKDNSESFNVDSIFNHIWLSRYWKYLFLCVFPWWVAEKFCTKHILLSKKVDHCNISTFSVGKSVEPGLFLHRQTWMMYHFFLSFVFVFKNTGKSELSKFQVICFQCWWVCHLISEWSWGPLRQILGDFVPFSGFSPISLLLFAFTSCHIHGNQF